MKKRQTANGFSLVEITLALGIIAFAMIPLMGLLPAGLSMQRKAVEETTLAQITQYVVGDLQRSEFDALVLSGTSEKSFRIRHFDDQGRYLASSEPPSATYKEQANASATKEQIDRMRIYDVKIEPALAARSGTAAIPSFNLLQAKITIAANPGHLPTTSGSNGIFGNPGKCEVRFAMIAKMK